MLMRREIVIRYSRKESEKLVSFEDDVKTYPLTKFQKTNQSTCINLATYCCQRAKGEERTGTF